MGRFLARRPITQIAEKLLLDLPDRRLRDHGIQIVDRLLDPLKTVQRDKIGMGAQFELGRRLRRQLVFFPDEGSTHECSSRPRYSTHQAAHCFNAPRYTPLKTGSRFSRNAITPSAKSWVLPARD